ncbi:MAG: DUF1611 domain-containing protein [Pirellulales bacterium]|nr:DUF1611 domain-containing protein [Pirellulales bacterium]
MTRRTVILTEGYSDPDSAKTAIGVLRYKPEEVVAVFDRQRAGQTCQAVLGVGGELPIVGSLDDASGANTLLLGTAPAGGKVPAAWRPIILEAIARRLNIVSGMHEFLADDPELAEAARRHGVELIDVRKNDEHDVANHQDIREECLRVHTMGTTTSCGKMVASIEVARGLNRAGVDAKFVPTGQTGILIEGDGCPIDRVIADFVPGAAENLVRKAQHHDVIVVEGQGSLVHPLYSCVTLGLLHGIRPDGLIFCHPMGREVVPQANNFRIPPVEKIIEFSLTAANLLWPCKMIGIALNGHGFPDDQVEAEREKLRAQFGLPVCDVIRHGPEELVQGVVALKRELGK